MAITDVSSLAAAMAVRDTLSWNKAMAYIGKPRQLHYEWSVSR